MMMARSALLWTVLAFSVVGFSEAAPATGAEARTALEGLVSNEAGEPLVGAVVSVFGKNLSKGAVTAVTDEKGRFQVAGIPPGLYRLRAYLSGFLPSPYAKVVIEEGMERVSSILSLAALEGADGVSSSASEKRSLAEFQWILRHGDRNVLRDEERIVDLEQSPSWNVSPSFDPEFAFSGEFGVRAATYDQGLSEFPGAGAGLDARLAYARLFIPTQGDGQWLVSAQLLESALSSWAGRAEYVSGDLSGHRLSAGVTYGNYLYGDLQDFRPPEAALVSRIASNRSREWFGSIYASDAFLLGSATVRADLAFEYFDYLETSGYASPRLEVLYPLGSGEKTVVRGLAEYKIQAPGGEDIGLLSEVAVTDAYGPSPAKRSLRAQSTARFALGVEHRFTTETSVGVRVFQENAADQLLKAFTRDRPTANDGLGHFLVSNSGDFQTRGIGLALSQRFGSMEGSLGYRFGTSQAQASRLAGANLGEKEEIHDIMTSVATSIERTRTRLRAAYRVVSHPNVAPNGMGFRPGNTVDSRFNIQVFQLLPFVGWNGTRWELMVAVRNLFYEDVENSSLLDEIAVVDAPKRVLGGVTVRF